MRATAPATVAAARSARVRSVGARIAMNESTTTKSSDQLAGTCAPATAPKTTAACHVTKSVSAAPR
jgi:hypothetical protein